MNKDLSVSSVFNNEDSTSLLPIAIALSTLSFYTLFTLLPNSNSLMVKWPWVFIWQFGLMLGPVALSFQLWQRSFRPLGNRLDWLAGAWCLVLILSATFSPFPHQAFWYGWAAICNIAFLYVLNSWLTSVKRVRYLLIFKGGLGIVFSGFSLVAWVFQTVRPYQQMLSELKSYGIERSFDLQVLTLRNWHPIGHQNYVAGYLLLALPLLIGLAFSGRGWQRFFWFGGFILSLATLYSTASRGSWFGLIVSLVVFVGLSAWQCPQLRKISLGSGLVGLGMMGIWGGSSDRIHSLFSTLFHPSANSTAAYRLVTNATGWHIGLGHPLLGAGLGSVTLLYQKYRPTWAGQTAELTYQLHSTPAQIWAELGIVGTLLTFISLFAIGYLSFRGCKLSARNLSKDKTPVSLIIGIISGLAGYSVYAITDYQLDNICISGTLIIFIAVLISNSRGLTSLENEGHSIDETPVETPVNKRLALAGAGLLTAISLWLYPIHRAWMLSSQGFLALQQEDIASFVANLEKAHQLAPWEPYYPYQLGWNLGDLAFQSTEAQQQEALRTESVKWFEKAIALSPHQEFGYSNLGWLLVNSEPKKATAVFARAAELVPDKRGAYFALGYSLLQQQETELATQAMVIALAQQPILLTSPIWRSAQLSVLYPKVLSAFEAHLRTRAEAELSADEQRRLYQLIGMLHWWQGEVDLAGDAFGQAESELSMALLRLADTRPTDQARVEIDESVKANAAISAWLQPKDSDSRLLKTLLLKDPTVTQLQTDYFTTVVSDIQASIPASPTFHDWLTQTGPSRQRRNQRLGFGTISRHIDGPLPTDYAPVSENVLMTDFFASLFPKPASQASLNELIQHLSTELATHLSRSA
ncbi:MAG: O-antigen ligase family protein [Phormidesmis sp.]